MFNSVAFNVVIGLVFIYLLYSLLATTVQELLASWLKLRATMLEKGIMRMLDDGGAKVFSTHFFNHPLIKYFIREAKWFEKTTTLPSYITPENFSQVVIDILKENQNENNPGDQIKSFIKQQEDLIKENKDPKDSAQIIEQETLKLIKSFAEASNYDMEKFKTSLETWFGDMMDRVGGWYKRQTQIYLLIIGMVVAITFNVDTIMIVKKLSHDKDAANSLASMASNYVKTHKEQQILNPSDSSVNSDTLIKNANSLIQNEIKDANNVLGLGYKDCSFCLRDFHPTDDFGFYLLRLLGWLITALAISLGAPFWFDLLKKLVNLRGTGQNPDEDKSKQSATPSTVVKRVG